MRLILFGGILIMCVLWLSIEGSGKTITVDDDGGEDYEKIQYAIDNSTEGDTIRVYEGNYLENVVVNVSVSLLGNGSEETTIDGGGNGDVVEINVDWVNLSGFKIINGNNTEGRGIHVESNFSHIFDNFCSNVYTGINLLRSDYCEISNNTCENNNEGIRLSTSSNCSIINNTCLSSDRGILLTSSSICRIISNKCMNNDRGIDIWRSDECIVSNNICENNQKGIYLSHSDNCEITFNSCLTNYDTGYGIYLYASNHCYIVNNICKDNEAYGIFIDNSHDTYIRNNGGIVKDEMVDNENDGFIPGFEIVLMIGSIGVIVFLKGKVNISN